ncbi:MAG: TolC family protein [Rikenellaceae bacterium]|nr:TolC family protein [Rikenellaceae bacterium]
MKKIVITTAFILSLGTSAYSRNTHEYILTPEEIEARFIENNLYLLAESLNVDIADAAVVQAKVWENPYISVNDINLWSTRSQREGEEIPAMFGRFGKNTEFSVELTQLISTAGKRRKLIGLEQAGRELAQYEFEELLWSLKLELRTAIHENIYYRSLLDILEEQRCSVAKLIENFSRQAENGNFSGNELVRLQSVKLSLDKDIFECSTEWNECQKVIKSLISADPDCLILIHDENKIPMNIPLMSISSLVDMAHENRPDLQLYKNQVGYYEKSLAYERSLRAPDVTLGVNYDRWGGVWKNFVGFGVGVDIPIFNRNQGNIRSAKLNVRRSELLRDQKNNETAHEIAQIYSDYLNAVGFYNNVEAENFISNMQGMLEGYKANLVARNIGLIEYIDFIDAYRESMETVLEARLGLALSYHELCFAVGTEIN